MSDEQVDQPTAAEIAEALADGRLTITPKQLSREDLKTMSSEQINKAREAGRLDELLRTPNRRADG